MTKPTTPSNHNVAPDAEAGYSRRTMLAAIGGLALGAAFAGPLQAAAATAPSTGSSGADAWPDAVMPGVMHRMVESNGLRLHVAEQGTGPLVILLHGFPECWYSWRHQMRVLAQAGFRAAAPDLRGYGRSDCPQDVGKYTIIDDIGDVLGLLDALGVEQAVLVGHDFGATVAWQAALLRPDRFRAVAALSAPFRPRGFGTSVPPTTVMPQNAQAVYYQIYLQTPEAEAALQHDVRRTLRSFFYEMSGDAARPAGGGAASGIGAGMIPRNGGSMLADVPVLPGWISDADIGVYVEELARSGFRGPLGWYREIDRSWELLGIAEGAKTTIPALYIAGDRDFVATANRRFVLEQATLVPTLRRAITLPGCGHWTQQERAPEVNAALIDFLKGL